MGIYYDQIFSYVGWSVLSALSLFAVGAYVFGMERVFVEQKKAGQYQAQAAVYQMLEEQYSQAERLRHDLKNHVLALRGLWEEQAWEKMGDYLNRMEGSAQLGTNEEATGNRAVDALLYQKRKTAEEKGIDWECDVRIPGGAVSMSLICVSCSAIFWTMRWRHVKDYRGRMSGRSHSPLSGAGAGCQEMLSLRGKKQHECG